MLLDLLILFHALLARRQAIFADILQAMATNIVPLDRQARSMQDLTNHGHGGQKIDSSGDNNKQRAVLRSLEKEVSYALYRLQKQR